LAPSAEFSGESGSRKPGVTVKVAFAVVLAPEASVAVTVTFTLSAVR
jgi:hypothetical protein